MGKNGGVCKYRKTLHEMIGQLHNHEVKKVNKLEEILTTNRNLKKADNMVYVLHLKLFFLHFNIS